MVIIPFTVDVPMDRWPIANWALIGLTTLMSFALFLNPNPEEVLDLALVRDSFSPLQLFTYVGVHGGLLHLIGNMIFLFCFGNAINAKLGHWQFLLLYFVLGAVAGGAWMLFGDGPALIGASGAIMGITGVFLVLYPRNDVTVFYWIMYRTGTFALSSGWLILLYMAMDVWGTVFGSGGVVAYVCHLGGWLVGGGTAVLLLVTKMVKSSVGEDNLLQVFGLQKRVKRHQHLDSYGRRIG